MQPQNTSAKNMQTNMQKKCEQKCNWQKEMPTNMQKHANSGISAFLLFRQARRSSKIEKAQKTRGKCKKMQKNISIIHHSRVLTKSTLQGTITYFYPGKKEKSSFLKSAGWLVGGYDVHSQAPKSMSKVTTSKPRLHGLGQFPLLDDLNLEKTAVKLRVWQFSQIDG